MSTKGRGRIGARLAYQFVRVRARFREELTLTREISRSVEAAKTRSHAETRRTAIHEAGHAALQIALGLGCGIVSIVPDSRGRWAGFCMAEDSGAIDDATAEPHMRVGREALYLRRAMVLYAGAEAIRQLIPTDPPDAGAYTDKREAASLIINDIDPDTESTELFFALAKRRCALLVAHYQPEIRALARTLEDKLILSGKAARKVFMKSLTERSGELMKF